jgi:hypothetical protein
MVRLKGAIESIESLICQLSDPPEAMTGWNRFLDQQVGNRELLASF